MTFGPDDKSGIVTGVFERRSHVLVADVPTSGVEALIVPAVLEKDPQSLRLGLADERRVDVAAAQIGEAADEAEHPVGGGRAVPGGGETGNAAGAGTGDGAIVGIVRKVVAFSYFRQDLFDQETRIAIAQSVVFEIAVVAILPVARERGKYAGVDED